MTDNKINNNTKGKKSMVTKDILHSPKLLDRLRVTIRTRITALVLKRYMSTG